MKFLIVFLFISYFIVSCSNDKNEIEECFEKYRTNVLNKNGSKAVECLDQITLDYYTGILSDVRHASKKTVYNRNIIDRLMILKTRNQISKDTINTFSTKSFISYTIKSGMAGYESLKNQEFVEVKEVNGKEANARIKIGGANKYFIYKFTKERSVWNQDGEWKINLKPLISFAYKAMKADIARKGISEDEYVMSILQATNDNFVNPDIWKPTMNE